MKTSFFLPAVAGFALVSSTMAIERSDQPAAATPAAEADVTLSAPAPLAKPIAHNLHTSSATEIVKMRDAGLDPSVIRAYVQNLRVPYKATADDILYLHDNKVPDDLIADWIKRGGELVTVAAQAPASSPDLVAGANSAGANAQNPPPVTVQQQPPAVVYQSPQVVTAPPTVVYSSPSYAYWDSYPYWYAPPLTLGFSWGWGHPYWGGHYYGGHYRGGPVYHAGFGGHFGGSHFGGHPGGFGGGHVGGSFGGGHFGGGGGGHHR